MPHTIKFVMDFVDGPSNDVVQIYIDGVLVHTGTSWENYFRFDDESNPSLVSNSRTVDSLLFRESGTATPGDAGKGFLIDNYSLTSSTVSSDEAAPDMPVHLWPEDGAIMPSSFLTHLGWTDVTDDSLPVTYYYQSANSSATTTGTYGGDFSSPAYSSGPLSASEIASGGTPEGVWYWHVRAVDAEGNSTQWTAPWHVIVDNTPADVTVTIVKYIGEEHATAENTDGASFPMHAIFPGGEGSYDLDADGFNGIPDPYEAKTAAMPWGSDYSTYEITSEAGPVYPAGAECPAGSWRLAGYKTGNTLAEAEGEALSSDVPAFEHLLQSKYVIVVNEPCVPPLATTLKVHIYKYLKSGDNETQVLDNAGIASFPMTASWSAANIGSGSGSYVLGNGLGGAAFLYAADTSAMQAPADYSTSETTGGQVLPVGAECEAGKYRLVGYRWGNSLSAAESASLSTTAPSFTGIISDRHVIVVNEQCDTPAVQNVTVHIYKYLSDGDGGEALIPNDTLITYHFPMKSSWSAANIGSGTGSYWLGNDHGHPSEGLNYTASTSIMTAPADYATHEVTTEEDDGSLVLPSDALCQPGMYKLLGYRTGETLAEAEAAPLSTTAPSFTGLTGDRHVIVVNEQCGDEPEVQTSTVTMCKVDQDEHGQSGWHLTLKGQTVNDITLYANSMLGADTASLSAFHSYLATISGTWTNVGHNDADAEYTSTSTPLWDEHMQGYPGYGDDIFDVQLNEQFIDWGSYNSGHTYTYAFTPVIDGSANFRVFDGSGGVPNEGWYGDNDGSLSLNVAAGYTGVTGENGCVTFTDVPYGTYTISEENKPGWTNVSGLGEVTVDEPTESFTVINRENETQPTMATLVLVKHTVGGDGTFEFGIESEGTTDASVETHGGYGTTTLELDPGNYDVTEDVPEHWNLTNVGCSYDGESEGQSLTNGERIEVYAGDTVTCTFTNTKGSEDGGDTPQESPQSPTPPSGGGGNNGPIFGSFGSFGGGSVLGASTTTLPNLPDSCTPLITGYMRQGKRNNDPAQVRALQEFLNEYLGLHIPVSGHFGPLTTDAVKQFQLKHASEILTPWGITDPTGFVYKTTQRWINLVHCSSLSIPMPTDLTPYAGE